MMHDPTPHSTEFPNRSNSPAWWWCTRAIVCIGFCAAMIFWLAQSTGFAMSIPYAQEILVEVSEPDSARGRFWQRLTATQYSEARADVLKQFGSHSPLVPWEFLTDWLWFLLIGPICAILFAALLPGAKPLTRLLVLTLCGAAALGAWGLYAKLFVWGMDFAIAFAQREIGWPFALCTVPVGVLSVLLALPLGRSIMRGLLLKIRNTDAIRAYRGLWQVDRRAMPC